MDMGTNKNLNKKEKEIMTTEWSNKKPTESGIYWYLRKVWVDGLRNPIIALRDTPQIVHVDIPDDENKIIDIEFIGSDCPDMLPNIPIMITEELRPRELSFMFQPKKRSKNEIRDQKRKDLITRKIEHLLIKVEEPKVQEE